jgi:transposase-like protein
MAQRPDSGKQQQWLERIQRWQRSRLTARAFCERHGLSESSFYSWRRTLRERGLLTDGGDETPTHNEDPAAAPGPRFLSVEVAATQESSSTLEIVVGDVVVRVPASFDATTLAQLLDVLRRRPC